MGVVQLTPDVGAANDAWLIYADSMRAVAAAEIDPACTPQMRANAALTAHQAWRAFQSAFERIAA